jgi:Xaa-Pro aminopeptidase
MQSTLLIGPYDWSPEFAAHDEFAERARAFWAAMPAECAGVVVWANRVHYAAMEYFTYFVPKLTDALLLLPRDGEPLLHASGGPHFRSAAARQTWLEVRPLKDHAEVIRPWLEHLRAASPGCDVRLIGGDAMPEPLFAKLCALGIDGGTQASAILGSLRSLKRPAELECLSAASAMLGTAGEALESAHRSGANAASALLAAEREAYRLGAQEVRTLFSIDGGVTLTPFDVDAGAKTVERLVAYLAVKQRGYWADGFFSAGPACPTQCHVEAAITDVAASLHAGMSCGELASRLHAGVQPFGLHPVCHASFGSGIGLELDEGPSISTHSVEILQAGMECSLRIGAIDPAGGAGLASALVRVGKPRSETLWSTGEGS